MAKKQKLLKNLLTSVSVASIVASIGGSSGAFAAAVVNIGGADIILDNAAPLNFNDGDNLEFDAAVGVGGGGIAAGRVTLTVDGTSAGDINDITATHPGNIVVARDLIITGKVTHNGNDMTATINDAVTLTLSGVAHDGLGDVTLHGVDSVLILQNNARLPAVVGGVPPVAANIIAHTDGKGILTFNENGTVAGNIGTAASALAEINVGANAAGGTVTLGGDVFTRQLVFTDASEVRIAGDFGGGNTAAEGAGEVDFNAGGVLTFNGAVGPKTFNATIKNGDNGTLNVQGRLKAIHKDIGNINKVNIGTAAVVHPAAAAVPGYLTIDASTGNVALLNDDAAAAGAGVEINFLNVASELRLFTNTAGKTITFHDNLPGGDGAVGAVPNGGIVLLEGAGNNTLTVQSAGGKTLGTAGLTKLEVRGNVTIAGGAANKLSIANTPLLNVIKGAVFTDESTTSALITDVHIGVGDAAAAAVAGAALDAGDPGAANYVLDAKYAAGDNLEILTGGHAIHFEHQDAQLTLRSSAATARTITLHDHLEGFDDGAAVHHGGIVLLENTGGGLLTLQSDAAVAVRTLGTAGREIDQLRVSGQVTIAGIDAAAAATLLPVVVAPNKLDVSNAKALNVIKGAVFTDESTTSAAIPVINIGVLNPDAPLAADRVPGAAVFVLDAKYANAGNLEILSAIAAGGHNNIHFSHADARLILRNSANDDRIITLANTLDPGRNAANPAAGNGIVELNSAVDTKTLTIAKAGAAVTLGTDANKLRTVIFSGKGDLDIAPTIHAYNIKLDGTNTPNVTTNTINGNVNFTKATTLTIRAGNNITGNVTFNAAGQLTGEVDGNVNFAAAGAGATLTGNVINGGNVTFNAAGQLIGNVDGDVTFAATGTVTNNVTGAVTVNAGNSTVGGTIGSVTFTGNGQLIAGGDIRGDVDFNNNGKLTAGGNIGGDVDFHNHDGTVILANTKTIGGAIKNSRNATLEFAGAGEVSTVIDKLKLLKAGAGNVKFRDGNHTITEIQGNGVHALTFADKFNLKGDINSTGGKAVNLTFEKNSIIDGIVGSDKNPVGDIQIKDGTVVFTSSINAKGKIGIAKAGTAEISKKFTAKSVKGEGKVKFNNPQELILDIPIETDNIEIAGDNIQAKKISAGNVLFSSSNEAILTLKEESIISNVGTTGKDMHSLALNADLTIASGNVGSESNRLKEIKLLGNHTISIIGNNLYSNISTANNNSGIVMFKDDDSGVAYGNLGTNELRLSDVIFDINSTVKGNVYSKKITIKDDKIATFAGTNTKTIDVPGVSREKFTYGTEIVSEEINAGSSSKIHFGSAALVKAPINGGQVELTDNVWFKEKVTSASPVTFAADKYVILERDVKFASIAANQAKIIMLGEKQTIAGDLTAKDLTMDLGISQVKYDNTAKLTGELKLRSFYDSSKLAGGNIEIQSNGKLDISQLDKLVVTIVGQTDSSKIPDNTEYVLISSVDGNNGISSFDPSKVNLEINEKSRFVSWTIDPSNLTLHAKDISNEVLDKKSEGLKEKLEKELEKTKESDSDSSLSERIALIKQLIKVTDKNSDAGKFKGEIGLMDDANEALAMEKLLPGNTNPISMELAFMVSEAISQVTSQIASRSVNMLPVASGDDDKVTYGVWGSPFYAVGHQEKRKGISGYRSKSIGGIFGFDGLINDDLLVGLAYSKIDTKMSHKDLKFGDKTNGITNLFSLYGSYKFPNSFFAEVVASYGITDIKNAEGRIVLDDKNSVTTGTAVAKYKSTSYSGQLLTGYNYQPSEKLTITPTIGLRYSQFMDDGHVQSGTACQNLTVKKTSYNKFEGIFGLKTATNIQLDQLLVIPELHGYVNYDFKGKSPKIDARLGGIDEPLPTKSVKPAKVSFTVGTGITVKSNMMEYGVTYNAHIADKYIGHQGSLKVKVNF